MLDYLKKEDNMTFTENGAVTYKSSMSECLNLFATIGALRSVSKDEIILRFMRAFAENADVAMKILFFSRDIREGLGERRVFRLIINWIADNEAKSLRKNIAFIPEYGRYDDLISVMGTACEKDALEIIKNQLKRDISSDGGISLLAKWLPSINTSNRDAVRTAKYISKYLGMTNEQYRKTLAKLRRKIGIIENNLREKDYTFDYSKQPSKAMFKYKSAFMRNDGERYMEFLSQVQSGDVSMHTGTLMPYDVISSCFEYLYTEQEPEDNERKAIDITWNSLENFGNDENSIAVIDGSGSMYGYCSPSPAAVALSLGIYFAERNRGVFHNHFITFSENPKLVEIKGKDIFEKVRYCVGYNEIANTNISRVFELILRTAVKNSVPQRDMPKKIYIISDMEFDFCVNDGGITNFEYAKKLFERNGYTLPDVIFWNVVSRNRQQPVTKNQQGAALVSGFSPRLFSMLADGVISPYKIMMEIIGSERYKRITA